MDPKDTQDVPASSETPGTQPQTDPNAGSAPTNAAPASDTAEKLFAGKYKTPDELATAYTNLEKKLGQKTYTETLGARILQETGYSVTDLESAGYTADEIVGMLVSKPDVSAGDDDTEPKTKLPPKPKLTNERVQTAVESSRIAKLEWELQLDRYFAKNPEAEEFRDEITDFHQLPQYKESSPAEIFNTKLQKFVKKGAESLQARHAEKENATMAITNNSAPQTKASDELGKSIAARGGKGTLEEKALYVAARLAGK